MKKVIFLTLALMLVASAAMADQVKNSKHNLSSTAPTDATTRTYYATGTTGDTGYDQICVFCHTPHGASTTAPLWNRTAPTTLVFTQYTSTTLDMVSNWSGTTPSSVSLACLSCHDGATGFSSLLNKPGTGSGAPTGWTFNTGSDLSGAGANVKLGSDLSNDHPVSIIYKTSAGAGGDTAFTSATTSGTKVTVGTLPLYNSVASPTVECGSCHNPHDKINGSFLRISNAASALCLTCHVK